jgi:hypothetical protein
MNTYNVPFAGNTSTCRETFVKGERVLEFNIIGDMTFEQFLTKPIFRDELVECLFSMSRQMVSLVQNGLKLDKMVFDLKYIYIRLSDFTVQTIYLPLEKDFMQQSVSNFVKGVLANITFAHTPAIECSNQILDYFNDHREFDVFKFNNFIKEMRANSQLLIIQNEVSDEKKEQAANKASTASARILAEEAARNADMARMKAESEAKRQTELAKQQAEIARNAEEMRMMAEAAKIQAEITRQQADMKYVNMSQTAVLYAEQVMNQQEENARKEAEAARIQAEEAAKNAEEERRKAEIEVSRLADEIRRARENEMRAEEARVRAEYEARKNSEEARRQAYEAKKKTEEANRLSENGQDRYEEGLETTELTSENAEHVYGDRKYTNYNATVTSANVQQSAYSFINQGYPVLIRKSTGEQVVVNKKVFCIGKADQGVDYKILGNKSISRRHAYITCINGVYYLRDNNSTNHVYLNGQQIYSNVEVDIPDNSIIRISNEEFVFKYR